MFHLLEKRIAEAFASRIESLYGVAGPAQTEQPKQASFGEISVPAAFQLARQLKKPPKAIAGELSAAVGTIEGVSAIEIAGNGPAQAWKSLDQTPQPLGLLGAPYRLPFRVIDILAPACLVAPDGLDMAMRIGTDPHVSPCRRNNQFLNSADVALS